MKKPMRAIKRFLSLGMALVLFAAFPFAAGQPVFAEEAEEFTGNPDEKVTCGSDGILHEGVNYLSARTVSRFDEGQRDAYAAFCNEAAKVRALGDGAGDVTIAEDSDGNIIMATTIYDILQDQELIFDGEELPAVLSEAEVEGEPDHTVPEDYAQIPDDVGTAENEGSDAVIIPEGADDTDVLIIPEGTEETDAAEETDLLGDADAAEEDDFAEENMELIEMLSAEPEELGEVMAINPDSLFSDSEMDYFRSKLSSTLERTMYDAAKTAMITKHKTGFTYQTTSHPDDHINYICNVLSALELTYPHMLDWFAKGPKAYFYWEGLYYRSTGIYEITVTRTKSDFYSKALDNSAAKKVNQLVKAAYAYAKEYYPANPTYGIVKYFDKWLSENNYYDKIYGLNSKNTAKYYYAHSSYGTLLKGAGVCESYAMAMSYLLDVAGIRNIYIFGYADGDEINGGHAWNYVKMPDGKYYLLDTTWNDVGSNSNLKYFLIPNDARHTPTGKGYGASDAFTFPATAGSKYSASGENTFKINTSEVYLFPKGKQTLNVTDYYRDYAITWTSSDPAVASVDANGMVTGKKAGVATISAAVAGRASSSTTTIRVCGIQGLQFEANNKATYSTQNDEQSSSFVTKNFGIKINNPTGVTAQKLCEMGMFDRPVVTVSNDKMASASASVSGDRILLSVSPKQAGSATFTVKFEGKTAKLTLKTTAGLQSGWFNSLPVSTVTYNGKVYQPKVTTSSSAPAGVTYKVTYLNNLNAGTATVRITGTGNYSGTIDRTFRITQQTLSDPGAKFASAAQKATYCGNWIEPATVVKFKNKVLKRGVDYIVRYDGKDTPPFSAGSYTLTVIGKGNYSGTLSETGTFTIERATLAQVKASCPSVVKYQDGGASCPAVTVKIGKNTLPASDYKVTYQNADGAQISGSAKLDKGKYQAVITRTSTNLTTTPKVDKIVLNFTVR